MKKIAIIGAGFFGLTAALALSKKYKISVFEKESKILQGASKANQLRFHLGYHYPRSNKTLEEIKKMNKSFINFYGKNIFGKTINYYGIAKKNSKTIFVNYLNFLKRNKLFYKVIFNKHFEKNEIQGSILVNEQNLNYFKLKKKIENLLTKTKVKVFLKKEFEKKHIPNYDKILIACYDQNNVVLENLGIAPKIKYKFELVEKIVIKLPKLYKNKSFLVLDGKFVSLDPYVGTNYHLLSDVKNSKLEICEGTFPKFKNFKKMYINRGIIKNIKVSKFKKFINRCSNYLPFLKKAKYIGSFFVIRSLQIKKEKTDERLSIIRTHKKKFISIHSGKWNTAVGVAKKIKNYI